MPDPAREIENLLHLYAERIDAGDLEGLAAGNLAGPVRLRSVHAR